MQDILPLVPAGSSPINDIVSFVNEEGQWTYYIGVFPFFSHNGNDKNAFRFAIASLINAGVCRPCEIVKFFGVTKQKVLRAAKQLKERGCSSFFRKNVGKKHGTVLTPEKLLDIQASLNRGDSRSEICEKFNIKRDTLRKAINDGRLTESVNNINLTTSSERSKKDIQASSGMGMGCTREMERCHSAVGILQKGSTIYEPAFDVPFGGVLTSFPALIANGLFSFNNLLGNVKGYYDTNHILTVMAFMYLCRFKNPEQLKQCSPGEFGNLIGLDRIPEERCLRSKMDDLSGNGKIEMWSAALSEKWLNEHQYTTGFLYVDGHVKTYSGTSELPRRYVSRQRLCLRGISNYWVSDSLGQPFFFVEKQVDFGLIQVLENEIIPKLLDDIPNQPEDRELAADPLLHRFVIVFDREGYSPAFFKRTWDKNRIACLTYRKNCSDKWEKKSFLKTRVSMPDGEIVEMKLAERGVWVENKDTGGMWCKEIRKLTESGHQTAMITTAKRLDKTVVAPAMFTRWCQENFFGYAMQHFPIELLSSYNKESFPDTEKVVNPEWRELNRLDNSLRNKLIRKRAKSVEMESNASASPNHKGHSKWLMKKGEIQMDIEYLEDKLEDVRKKKKKIPKHITWAELPQEMKFMKISSSRRMLVNTVAMIAYRAETAMASMLSDSSKITFSKARSIIRNLLKTTADIIPDYKKNTLTINLHNMITAGENAKVASLLKYLNQTETYIPETSLRLIFKIEE